MDAAALPFVHEITLCKTPQTGGTECVHNFVGYCIDRAPGPVLYVYPDEKTAAENSKDRVLPMIQASPRLRSYFTGQEKDKSSFRINLQHMLIYFGWGRSVASIANKPIRYGIADEIDKPGFDPGKKETGVLELIDKRFTTYRHNYKFFKISTPTLESGNVWKELNSSDVIFDYYVICPKCGKLQLMDFKGIKWNGGSKADPKEIKNGNLAWYECVSCRASWDDHVRNLAVQRGQWIARKPGPLLSISAYLERFRAASIGFHIPAWISYFVSLSEVAAAFLSGLDDPVKMQDFLNSYCALPWKDIVARQDEDQILGHKINLPAGVVPSDAIALTCGIDVQMKGFWFVVRAWKKDLSSHLVQYGYMTTWEDIETLVFGTRFPVEGKDAGMGIWRAGIDSGGGKAREDDWSKTEEVYDWVRRNGRNTVFAIKGSSRPQVKKVNPRVIDKMARGNRIIKGGLVLYFLDVDQFKDQFHWRLSRSCDESQCITLNADTGLDYARQILAEHKEKGRDGKKKWVQIRRDNHLLDCENIAAACADPEWAPSLSFIAETHGRAKRRRRILNQGVPHGR
jgi:phage terminase large subunit GpA-like protein